MIDQLLNNEKRNKQRIEIERNYRPNNYVPIQLTLCYRVSCSPLTKYYTYPPTDWIGLVIILDAIMDLIDHDNICTVAV